MGEPLDRSNRWLGLTTKFESAYPQLEDAIIKFTESDFGNNPKSGVWSLRIEGGQMRCSNPRCNRGGYEFDREVNMMLYSGENTRDIWLNCRGDEGSPKGRNKGRECLHSVKGTITLRLRSDPNGNPSEDESPK